VKEGRRVDGDWRMRTPGTGAAAAAEDAGDMMQSSAVVRRAGEVWSSVDSVFSAFLPSKIPIC